MSYSRCAAILLILLAAAVVSACSRSRSEEPTSASDQPVQAVDAPEDGQSLPAGRAGAEEAVPLRLTDQGRARAERPAITPADPRDSAFEGVRFSAVPFHVRDEILGPIDGRGSARDRAVLSVSADLFAALLQGEIPGDMLSSSLGPGGRAVLEDLIWRADTLDEFRLGVAVTLTDTESSVPFRLMGESKHALGEVILEKLGDQWYTADIQVEFLDRDTTSPFDPGAIRSDGTI